MKDFYISNKWFGNTNDHRLLACNVREKFENLLRFVFPSLWQFFIKDYITPISWLRIRAHQVFTKYQIRCQLWYIAFKTVCFCLIRIVLPDTKLGRPIGRTRDNIRFTSQFSIKFDDWTISHPVTSNARFSSIPNNQFHIWYNDRRWITWREGHNIIPSIHCNYCL
jgi:hypothetical protein